MGPAILFCPSSSAVHLWGQIAPLQKARHREGSIFLPHGFLRCSASADLNTGESRRRQAFFFYPASSSEKCRKSTYPFAWRRKSAAAAGNEVSVEEASVAESEAPAEEGMSSKPSSSNEEAPVATERKTQARRTLSRSNSNANKAAVVVSPAELIPGATFPGKVITIQTFGAFVDFGAFTNGLVHISRLRKSYVKKVEDVVQVGQDVKVQVLEFDSQANRISLMLVEEGGAEAAGEEGDVREKQTQRSSQQQGRPPRRDSSRRTPNSPRQAVTTTMKKDEIASGTVKNIIKSGVFLTLPDGSDGYLPAAEVIFKGANTNMESQFQVGQEVTVRVLRIDKGRVNLTMRREVNYEKLNEDLNKDVVDGATNPFEIAFRRNKLIASFLADRDRQKAQAEETTEKDEAVSSVEDGKDAASVEQLAMEEKQGKASGVDAVKDEMISSEAVTPAEEKKGTKLAVEQDEDVAEGVEQKAMEIDEDTKEDEAVSSVEEAKDETPVGEKLAVEEEKGTAIGVDAMKDDEGVSSEAMNPVEVSSEAMNPVEGKDLAEEPVDEEEKDVAVGVLSEAMNPVEVKDLAEEPVAEEGKDKAVGVSAEPVRADGEEKDPTTVVEKPAMESEKDVAIGANLRKDEGISPEAVNAAEVAEDMAAEEKPDEEETEKAVSGIETTAEAEKLAVEEEEEVAVRSVQ